MKEKEEKDTRIQVSNTFSLLPLCYLFIYLFFLYSNFVFFYIFIQILEKILEKHREDLKKEKDEHQTEKANRLKSEQAMSESVQKVEKVSPCSSNNNLILYPPGFCSGGNVGIG